jgi:hypothetical protein
MIRSRQFPFLSLFFFGVLFHLYAQAPPNSNDCTSGPNAYTINSPCIHVYDATPEVALQIVRENRACRLLGQTQVYCTQPLTKNYGQKEGKFRPTGPPSRRP